MREGGGGSAHSSGEAGLTLSALVARVSCGTAASSALGQVLGACYRFS